MHALGENEEERRDAVDRVARLSTETVKSSLTRYMPRVNEELVEKYVQENHAVLEDLFRWQIKNFI